MDLVKVLCQYLFLHKSHKCCFVVNLVICALTITSMELYFRNITSNIVRRDESIKRIERNISVLNVGDDLKMDIAVDFRAISNTSNNSNIFKDNNHNFSTNHMDVVKKLIAGQKIFSHSNSFEDNNPNIRNNYGVSGNDSTKEGSESQRNFVNHNKASEKTTIRTMLLWNSNSASRSISIKCPKYKCLTTSNLSHLSTADAVIFHVFYLPNGTIPRRAHPTQVFVFLDYESQWRTYHLKSRNSSPFAFLNDYYNVTMTFKDHRDTDVYVPYGSYTDQAPHITTSIPSISEIRNKTQYAAWMVSNCNAPSSRMAYYKELSKHISVDIYGACGNRSCSLRCEAKLSRDYRFYLAFENSFCDSYATEKVRLIDNNP